MGTQTFKTFLKLLLAAFLAFRWGRSDVWPSDYIIFFWGGDIMRTGWYVYIDFTYLQGNQERGSIASSKTTPLWWRQASYSCHACFSRCCMRSCVWAINTRSTTSAYLLSPLQITHMKKKTVFIRRQCGPLEPAWNHVCRRECKAKWNITYLPVILTVIFVHQINMISCYFCCQH